MRRPGPLRLLDIDSRNVSHCPSGLCGSSHQQSPIPAQLTVGPQGPCTGLLVSTSKCGGPRTKKKDKKDPCLSLQTLTAASQASLCDDSQIHPQPRPLSRLFSTPLGLSAPPRGDVQTLPSSTQATHTAHSFTSSQPHLPAWRLTELWIPSACRSPCSTFTAPTTNKPMRLPHEAVQASCMTPTQRAVQPIPIYHDPGGVTGAFSSMRRSSWKRSTPTPEAEETALPFRSSGENRIF